MGLSDAQDDVGLSAPIQGLPQVCLLLPSVALRHDLQSALHPYALSVTNYDSADLLFKAIRPQQIDCLVLSTSGSEEGDGVRLLEQLQATAQFVPTIVIATDPQVAHAVRAMQALAVECFDQHTPLPILVRAVRTLAAQEADRRQLLEMPPGGF